MPMQDNMTYLQWLRLMEQGGGDFAGMPYPQSAPMVPVDNLPLVPRRPAGLPPISVPSQPTIGPRSGALPPMAPMVAPELNITQPSLPPGGVSDLSGLLAGLSGNPPVPPTPVPVSRPVESPVNIPGGPNDVGAMLNIIGRQGGDPNAVPPGMVAPTPPVPQAPRGNIPMFPDSLKRAQPPAPAGPPGIPDPILPPNWFEGGPAASAVAPKPTAAPQPTAIVAPVAAISAPKARTSSPPRRAAASARRAARAMPAEDPTSTGLLNELAFELAKGAITYDQFLAALSKERASRGTPNRTIQSFLEG